MKRSPSLLSGCLVAIVAGVLATPRPARSLTAAEIKCVDEILLSTRRYICKKQGYVVRSLRKNIRGQDARCAVGFRCLGGPSHGANCNPALANADCPAGECQPNRFTGNGLARLILHQQNLFKIGVYNDCTLSGATLGGLGYPNAQCPFATDFDEVVDCVLRSNSAHPLGGDPAASSIIDAVLEPLRTTSGHLPIPHPPYPTTICGVPGSWVLDWGSEGGGRPAFGREGFSRLLLTDGCVGDVCQTKGSGVIDNMLDDPETLWAGVIPLCAVTRAGDTGNSSIEDGSIDLVTGQQTSFNLLSIELYVGACPKCLTASGACSGGVHAGGPCVSRGAEDISCPPGGAPFVVFLQPVSLTTEPTTLLIPAHNPGGGVTNPAATFCGACDLDPRIGCQSDQDCDTRGACGAGIGAGCCVFGSNTGFNGYDSALSVAGGGARGPLIPHLSGLWCMGETGNGLIDASVGLPGPVRYIEPRVNVVEW